MHFAELILLILFCHGSFTLDDDSDEYQWHDVESRSFPIRFRFLKKEFIDLLKRNGNYEEAAEREAHLNHQRQHSSTDKPLDSTTISTTKLNPESFPTIKLENDERIESQRLDRINWFYRNSDSFNPLLKQRLDKPKRLSDVAKNSDSVNSLKQRLDKIGLLSEVSKSNVINMLDETSRKSIDTNMFSTISTRELEHISVTTKFNDQASEQLNNRWPETSDEVKKYIAEFKKIDEERQKIDAVFKHFNNVRYVFVTPPPNKSLTTKRKIKLYALGVFMSLALIGFVILSFCKWYEKQNAPIGPQTREEALRAVPVL